MVRSLLVALALCVACGTASAAPFGASDTAFSGDGWLTLGGGHDYVGQAYAVELQPDRKIISAGTANVGALAHFALTRHTPANGIDTTFGEQGKVVTPMGNTGVAAIVDLEVVTGGAILALGNARQDNEPRIALARYTSAGVLDASFGTGGKVIDDLLADGATATAMARAADGSILVTGQIRDGAATKVFLRRFTAGGTPDLLRTFTLGDTGCATASRIFARPDGSIVVIGSLCRSTAINGATYGPDGYVLKLTADGVRRGDFGTNGLAVSTIPDARFTGGIVDSQGRFVLYGGGRTSSFGTYFTATAIGRLTADGAPDPSFGGGDGLTVIAGQDILLAIDADELADGRLWITASAQVGSNPILGAWGSALLNANGSPVTEYGFDGDGSRADQIGFGQTSNSEAPGQSVIDADQTLLTAGRASTTVFGGFLTENRTFGLRRFSLPKGTAVAPYNGYTGSSTAIGQTTTAIAQRLKPLAGGGVIAVGSVVEERVLRFAAWKLGADGTPDAGWGAAGLASPVIGASGAHANDIVPATGGGYYAVGQANDGSVDTLAVVKLTAAGALDATFSGDGILLPSLRPTSGAGAAPVCTVTPPLCLDNDGTAGSGGEGNLVLAMADGGVLVVGTAGPANNVRGGADATRVVLARYTAAGLPAPGFGTGGLVQLYRNGAPSGNTRMFAATLRGADKLLVAGTLGDAFAQGPVSELQFNVATGALDPGFSDDGFIDAPSPTSFRRTGMRFAGDTDTLVISGYDSSPYPPVAGRFSGVLSPLAGFGSGGFASVSRNRRDRHQRGRRRPVAQWDAGCGGGRQRPLPAYGVGGWDQPERDPHVGLRHWGPPVDGTLVRQLHDDRPRGRRQRAPADRRLRPRPGAGQRGERRALRRRLALGAGAVSADERVGVARRSRRRAADLHALGVQRRDAADVHV